MKEKSSTQQNKSTLNSATVEGSGGRHCVMSREMEKHVKDMHAKARPNATPSLRNIKVGVYHRLGNFRVKIFLSLMVTALDIFITF